ncbi:phosphoribosylanthranilate isomerase, partial [Candidatus Bathyarchaeota archaeon]
LPSLSPERAIEVFEPVRGRAKTVMLPITHSVEEIIDLAGRVEPDYVQVASYPEYLPLREFIRLSEELRAMDVGVIRVVPVDGHESLSLALEYEAYADIIMVDSSGGPPFPHVREFIGGTGRPHNHEVSARIRESIGKPLILAGGLSPENVADAIRRVKPWGVDAASSLNRIGEQHRKDPDRVRAFIEAVRRAEREAFKAHR